MRTGNEHEIRVCLIRHGATKSNEERRYVSVTDEELSEKGREACLIRAELASNVDEVYISPLKRCRQTAEIIFAGRQDFIEIPELKEMNFGIFEGKNYEELKDDREYSDWLSSNCMGPIRNGESRADFTKRVTKGLHNILKMSANNKCIAIVCHGGTIMAITSQLLGSGYYDHMLGNGQLLALDIKYTLNGEEDVDISSCSIAYRDNN